MASLSVPCGSRTDADPEGFEVNMADLQNGMARAVILSSFTSSAEFKAISSLASKDLFVCRSGYLATMRQTLTPVEVAAAVKKLKNADGSGSPLQVKWDTFFERLLNSKEYKNASCITGYYTLGGRVNTDAILLQDLFAGKARLQLSEESSPVTLTVPTALKLWDNKLPVFADPRDSTGVALIAFTRAYIKDPNTFTIVQVPAIPFFRPSSMF